MANNSADNSIRLATIKLKKELNVLGNTFPEGKSFQEAELSMATKLCRIELDGPEYVSLTPDQYEIISFNGEIDKQVVQDVIDRMKRYNGKYKKALAELNSRFKLSYTITDHVVRSYE